jgi:hypothetical protein
MAGGKNILDSFFMALGFDVDNSGLVKFEKHAHSLTASMHALGALAGIELVKRLGAFVERSIAGAASVQKFSEATGIAAEDIAALGKVGFEADVSMETMQGSIMGVARATGQAAMGIGRNVKLFQSLGINAKDSSGKVKSSIAIMGEFADKFKGMGDTQRLAIAGRLGIDANLAAMMAKEGGAGFLKKYEAARGSGVLTAEDYEQADQTEKAFERIHKTIGSITTLIANQLGPSLRKGLDGFQAWFKENRVVIVERIRRAMSALSTVIVGVWNVGVKLYQVLVKLYEFFNKNERAGQALRAALAAIVVVKIVEYIAAATQAVIAFGVATRSVLTPWALLIGGVVLLVQDWMAFKDGEESVFKDLSEWHPVLLQLLQDLQNLPIAFGELWKDMKGVGAQFKEAWASALTWLKNEVLAIWTPLEKVYGIYLKIAELSTKPQKWLHDKIFGEAASAPSAGGAAPPTPTQKAMLEWLSSVPQGAAVAMAGNFQAMADAKTPAWDMRSDVQSRQSMAQPIAISGTQITIVTQNQDQANRAGASVMEVHGKQARKASERIRNGKHPAF